MDFKVFENAIIIINDSTKNSFLNEISAISTIINCKIITLSDLKKKYLFTYDNKTIHAVMKKYGVIKDVAKIYIENMYYVNKIVDKKTKFLSELREYLLSSSLIEENQLFKNFLRNKKIVLYNLSDAGKFYKNIFEDLRKYNDIVNIDNFVLGNEKKELYAARNQEEEIIFVASKICNLIKVGIDINKIYLANVQSNYVFNIKKVFNLFNIPVSIPNFNKCNGTLLVKKFKEFYNENIEETIKKISVYVKSESESELFNSIVKIVNDYSWSSSYIEVKDELFYDLDNLLVPEDESTNSVKCVDFINDIFTDGDYIFLINYNQGVIPSLKKDEDYLSDVIKKRLNVDTSYESNSLKNKIVQNKIKSTKNLIVSYSTHDLNSDLFISTSYDQELFQNVSDFDYRKHSNNFNKVMLVSKLDVNRKFGVFSNELYCLQNHYRDLNYLSYDNKYKTLNRIDLPYNKEQLKLSYSSINTYYSCAFRYYLDYILKLNSFEDTFQIIVGNIFHKILSISFLPNFDFDKAWEDTVFETNYEFKNSEKYFLNKLKKELIFIIDTINNQQNYSKLLKNYFEKELVVKIKDNVIFKGIIDKILYETFNDETIVQVVDYKTGNPTLNLENIVYGLDMQLAIYVYLIKKSGIFSNVKIGGFYLQKILDSNTDIAKREESLKLQGYSNSQINILEKVDSSYENSKVIKSLKMGNNGFYKYAKVLRNEEIDLLVKIVEEKIDSAASKISNGTYDINPKEIDDKNVSCKFCKYADICYMSNKDIVKYKKVFLNEILGRSE